MSFEDRMTGIVLETSARCRLKCPFCFLRSYSERPDPDLMPVRVCEAVLPYLSSLDSVDLTGWGEPFMNPDLFKIIRLIRRDFSKRMSLTTNGLQLDTDSMKRLIDLQLDTVCVSVDSCDEPGYKEARPGGSFSRLRLVLDEFTNLIEGSKVKKPEVFAAFLLRSSSMYKLPDFVSMAAGHGLRGVVLQQLTGVFSERGLQEAAHSAYYRKDFDEEALKEVLARAKDRAPRGFIVVGPERVHDRRRGDCGCFDLSRPFVTPAGDVSACCAMAYPCVLMRRDRGLEKTEAVSFGNVLESPLPDIFELPDYRMVRRAIREGVAPKACGDCIALYTAPGEVWTA